MKYLPIILTIGTIILLVRVFRVRIVKYLLYLRGKMTVAGIREAIKSADADKAKTARKNMVVFNTVSGSFEPIQKRVLKAAARKNKNKNNGKMTEGRKRALAMQPKKNGYMTMDRVKKAEEKSIYITN